MNTAMYILVNSDIKIGKGKLAGQVGHAVEVYHEITKIDEEILKSYKTARKKIILKCSQEKLEQLEKDGFLSIRDKGLTQLDPNTLTCVNLGILDKDNPEFPEFVKELKLYNS